MVRDYLKYHSSPGGNETGRPQPYRHRGDLGTTVKKKPSEVEVAPRYMLLTLLTQLTLWTWFTLLTLLTLLILLTLLTLFKL